MVFVDIPTLNGGHVHVASGSVYRTPMPSTDVAQLPRSAGAKLVQLTASDGIEVFLSIPAITVVRPADPHSDPPGANAVPMVSGQRQAVQETQAQVEQSLSAGA